MMEKAQPRNKGGRPSKDPAGGKRPTVTFRCRSALQAHLQEAAASSDRSVSEEIERRLEESFKLTDIVKAASDAAYDKAISASISFFKNTYGGEECMNFGASMASALFYAMHAEGLSGTKYKEIKQHSDKFALINDFVRRCVTSELTSENQFSGSDQWSVGIKANIYETRREEERDKE